MTELAVEAVDQIEVDAPEYVLYGGKGGVGKTTMAAATGIASAASGVETLVISTDPAHSLADTFDADLHADPTRIDPGIPVYAAEIDPDAAMAETGLFDEDGALGGIGDLLGDAMPDDDIDFDGTSMPGADEAAAVQQLLRFLDDDRFDRVIVDTAPTGHTLRLLELPDAMDSMVGRVLSIKERLSGMMESVAAMFGGDEPDESDFEDLRALSDRIERLRSTLRDPSQTDFRIVMVPEEMSVTESRRLKARLEEFGIPVGTVVVNRVMEPLSDVAPEVDADFVAPNLETCAFCQRRWKVQQGALESASELFRGHAVKRVPLFADEVHGFGMLRAVAACLSK